MKDNCISAFEGPYAFLSNFFPRPMTYNSIRYYCSEAAFQAQKTTNKAERSMFRYLDADAAKICGRSVELRPDWYDIREQVMYDVVKAKFQQHADLAGLLLETGDTVLKEGNHWGDRFWGVDEVTGEGENHLGIILMQVRDELRRM